MATINFLTKDTSGTEYNLTSLGYGLGFFTDSFGTSVAVGNQPNVCYITNSNGSYSGVQTKHVTYLATNSGQPQGSSSGVLLTQVMNSDADLNIRFTHSTAVRTINAKFRIYDRTNINNNPSGITCLAAQVIHPNTSRDNTGSGNASWTAVQGSGSILNLATSPLSGGSGAGGSGSGVWHDWYIALSPSPSSLGAKTFAAYASLEYL